MREEFALFDVPMSESGIRRRLGLALTACSSRSNGSNVEWTHSVTCGRRFVARWPAGLLRKTRKPLSVKQLAVCEEQNRQSDTACT